jgi:hypothetical protein
MAYPASQSLPPRRGIASSAGEPVEQPVELFQHIGWIQALDAGGSQLNGKGKPIETVADFGDERSVSLRQLKGRLDGGSALGKKRHSRKIIQKMRFAKLGFVGGGQGRKDIG